MMDYMKIAVIILNFKGWQDTKKCLNALNEQTYDNFEVFLIDNGSKDGKSIPELKKEIKKIKKANSNFKITFREEEKNTGFTGGVNIGLKWAIENKFEAGALLNNDTMPKKDWLTNLANAMKEQKADAVTSLMLDKNGEFIDDAGDLYSTWGIPYMRDENKPKDEAPESGFIFGATGGATLYRTEVFEEIGFFDEDFFAYNEDVDISWRMQLAGKTVWYEKSAVVLHKHSATSSKIPGFTINQVFKNLPQVFWKNVPFPMIIPMFFKFHFLYVAFIFYQIPKGGAKFALKGYFQSIKMFPAAIRKRKKIQKTKVVSNKYLKSLFYKGLPLRQVKRIKKFFRFKVDK